MGTNTSARHLEAWEDFEVTGTDARNCSLLSGIVSSSDLERSR
jgi:hypothetical protein